QELQLIAIAEEMPTKQTTPRAMRTEQSLLLFLVLRKSQSALNRRLCWTKVSW
ncbi:unnamed protein product, partial [Amoebophrya sp. A25]